MTIVHDFSTRVPAPFPNPLRAVCSDCDGTGIDEARRPSAAGYVHHPSSLCRECGGRGTVLL